MRDNTYSIGCGSTSMCILGLVLVLLKVGGYISCGWWLVLMPLYLPFVLGIMFFVVMGILWIWANTR